MDAIENTASLNNEQAHAAGYQEEYLTVATQDLLPSVSLTLNDIFSDTPSAEAHDIRQSITHIVGAELLGQAVWGTKDSEELKDLLRTRGINVDEIDEHATAAVEQMLGIDRLGGAVERLLQNNKDPLEVQGRVSEGVHNALFALVTDNFAANFYSAAADSHYDVLRDIISDVRQNKLNMQDAMIEAGQVIEGLLFTSGKEAHAISDAVDSAPSAVALRDNFQLLNGHLRTNSMQFREFIGGATIKWGAAELLAQKYKTVVDGKETTVRSLADTIIGTIDSSLSAEERGEWQSFSTENKIKAALLVTYNKASMAQKLRMVVEDPAVLHVFKALPDTLRGELKSWEIVGAAVQAMNKAADTYALQMTGASGLVDKGVKMFQKARSDVHHYYTVPGDENQPNGPDRKPNWKRIAITVGGVTVLFTIAGVLLAACGTSPSQQKDKTPVPGAGNVNLVTALQPSLVSELSTMHVAIGSGCTIPQAMYNTMLTSGLSTAMHSQLTMLESAVQLQQFNQYNLSSDATVVCVVDTTQNKSAIYVESGGTILMPTAAGPTPAALENGFPIPKAEIQPTPTSAPTLEPTPTVDPRLGPPPTVDAGYTLGQNPVRLMYTETNKSNDTKYWSPELHQWTDLHGSFNLIDKNITFEQIAHSTVPFTLFVDPGLNWSQNVTQRDESAFFSSHPNTKLLSLSEQVLIQLANRSGKDTNAMLYQDWISFASDVSSGRVTIPFTVGGVQYNWNPADGADEYLVKSGTLAKMEGVTIYNTNGTIWTVFEKNKTLKYIVEVSDLSKVGINDLVNDLFAPMFEVTLHGDKGGVMPDKISSFYNGQYNAGNLCGFAAPGEEDGMPESGFVQVVNK